MHWLNHHREDVLILSTSTFLAVSIAPDFPSVMLLSSILTIMLTVMMKVMKWRGPWL